MRDGISLPGGGRVAVLCNATTVSSSWLPSVDALLQVPGIRLERIFSPQHGFASEKQDNMVESVDSSHPRLGIPIISLYGDRREVHSADLDGIDAVIIDLPDIGTRVYTFLTTAIFMIRAAAGRGVPVFILDRPNPIGGVVEGPVLDDAFHSFVGMIDVPLRHGLTIGELCLYGAWRMQLPPTQTGWIRVMSMEGWRRSLYYNQTGLPWTMPSPNMPTPETALVYAGQVVLEGTNLSEGRGTTRPFEFFGAPYLDPPAVLDALQAEGLLEERLLREERSALAGSLASGTDSTPEASVLGRTSAASEQPALAGALLREVTYQPTFQKYARELVRGFQLHVIDRNRFRPVMASMAILWAVKRVHPKALDWREPPYEYEKERMPIDLIYGTDQVRLGLQAGMQPREIAQDWESGVAAFKERVRPFLLYEQ